ncbi:ceramide synthase 1-like [Patiria miniata]|uniref:TLC domain-containing protein n=1 Tax=Patiria miniata TaxID=46514 RepID=A0A914BM27_PATMI|nr:ceramide synthase 1-like [Patiria miniata]
MPFSMFNLTANMDLQSIVVYPAYHRLVTVVVPDLWDYYHEAPTQPDGFLGDLRMYCMPISWQELKLPFMLAVVWTLLRMLMTTQVFKPLAKWGKLREDNINKLPESAWRCLCHCITWSLAAYVLLKNYPDIFFRPDTAFKDWKVGKIVPSDIYLVYAIQGGYYLHRIVDTLFHDIWRTDTIVMSLHHVLSLTLITFSYASRYHNIGILVSFFHDFDDIWLEFSKVCVYLKFRNGKKHQNWQTFANICFTILTVSWCVMRLYWYPLKVLRNCTPSVARQNALDIVPFGILFNVMLWILLAMDIYWFMHIVVVLKKVAMGQMKELDDIRDFDVNKEIEEQPQKTTKKE